MSGPHRVGRLPVFALALLGRPEVAFLCPGEDAAVVHWRVQRAFELVAFLALAPDRWASRQAIVEALWSERSGGGSADRNFLPTVSDARRAMRRAAGGRVDPLLREQGGYRLGGAVRYQVDADRLVREADLVDALEAGHPERAFALGRRAWQRYRGPLLAGIDRRWAEAPRAALVRRYRRLLATVASLAVELGRLEDAIDAQRTLMVDDPYDEAVHLALMELYAHQRRPDLVRRQFMRLEDYLDELDVAPTEAARERYRVLVASGADAFRTRDRMPAP